MQYLAENYREILFNTAAIFSSVFEIVLAYILAGTFYRTREKIRRFDFLPFVGLAGIMIFFQQRGMSSAVKYAAECTALVVFLFVFYEGRIKSKLTGAAAFTVMVSASEILARHLFSVLTSVSGAEFALSENALKLASFTAANALMVLFSVLLTLFAKKHSGTGAGFIMWAALFSVPVVTLIIFSVFQYYTDVAPENTRIRTYIYISSAGLILVNALVFVLFSRLQKQLEIRSSTEILKAQLDVQEKSVQRLETLYNRTREFRHDIKNHILVMNMLSEKEDYDGLKSYIRDMSVALDESDYVKISGISAVDAILNEKMYEAQSRSITTGYDCFNLGKNEVDPMDLCVILSNALDNAIEANEKIAEKPSRYIKLKVYGNETFTVISVSNPDPGDVKFNSSGLADTTKKDTASHGFGLRSIESTVKKYNGEMLAKSEDGIFTLVVRLNKKAAARNQMS